MAGPLARIEEARRLLAEANTVDEVKDIRDMAEQARLYAEQKRLGIDAMNQAAELKVRAERRMGELLQDMPKHPPGRYRSTESTDIPPRLADIGISKNESSQYQRLAAVPTPVFEESIEAVKDEERPISTGAVLRSAQEMTVADGVANGSLDWSKLPSLETPVEEKVASRIALLAFGINKYTPQQIADASLDVNRTAWQSFANLAVWIEQYAAALRLRHEGPIRSVK